MSDIPLFTMLRIWAAMAWADDVIVPEEETALKEFISLAPVTDKERKTALSWLDDKIVLEDIGFDGLSDEVRIRLYRSVARIAALDKRITATERVFLTELGQRLALDADTITAIETQVFEQLQAVEQVYK